MPLSQPFERSAIAVATCLVAGVLAVAAVSDVATGRIPNAVVACAAFATIIAVLLVSVGGEAALLDSLVRLSVAQLAGGTVVLFVVWLARPQLVGGGDVKLLAVAAAMVGLVSPIAAAVTGAATAVVHSLACLATGRRSMPFAPALFVGFVAGAGFAAWGVPR